MKCKLYICFTAEHKNYFIFRKNFVIVFICGEKKLMEGGQMLTTLKYNEIFSNLSSFNPMLMKF